MAKNDGSGGYWRGDKWIEITWGDKIRKTLLESEKDTSECERCGKRIECRKGVKTRFCSPYCRYHSMTGIDKKASVLGANLLMGHGKKNWIIEQLTKNLDFPCKYCGETLTLENITIDHKEPYESSAKRRNKKENEEYRRHMDRRENLQVICQACNQLKGSLNERQFESFREFLAENPDMADYLTKRLMRGLLAFGKGRRP